MSLTNPKDVVTEERLKDFYDGIYPYLGGMPEVLANKFSRSDIYSTTEKMIGQWTDKKPIYQKTINFGTLPNATTKSVAHGISNLGTVVYIQCTALSSSGTWYNIPFSSYTQVERSVNISVNATNINVETGYDYSSVTTSYVTFYYTKTTDSAISIGADTDYSTTEKIVGTYIDGKPVYQKVMTSDIPNCTSAGTNASTEISIGATIDTVVKCEGFLVKNGVQTSPTPCLYNIISDNLMQYVSVGARNNSATDSTKRNKLVITNSCPSWNNTGSYVIAILQYTKTS